MTDDELRRALASPKDILAWQILTGAMVAGAMLFLLVTVTLHFLGTGDQAAAGDDDPSLFVILSGVHAVLFVSTWTLAVGIYRFLTRDLARADSAEQVWNRLRSAAVLRLALLEGCALFGVVVCLLGVVQDAITQRPWIWANAASAVLFLVFTVVTFPGEERLVSELTGRRA